MNLDNLKSEWSAMNDRMEKQEILKEKMFCQILNTKSERSLNRLVAYEVISLIASILFIPALLYMFNRTGMEFVRTVIVGAIVLLGICVVWYGIKVFVLSKIDFTKTLKNNLFYINKYAVYIKYEKLIGYYFIIPLCVLVDIIYYLKLHVTLYSWLFLSCIGIAAILFTVYFYRLYNKNISTIQQNLEELRELEEK
jgi:hypothetical protein